MSDNEHTKSEPPASENNESAPTCYNGRVKWFNNRAGYGFVTVMDKDKKDVDVFVHHSGVKVENEQYRYLVQGEYVSFNVSKSDNKDHKCQATNVRGVLGGKLMCETHLEMRKERDDRMRGSENGGERNYNHRYRGGGGGGGGRRTEKPRQYGGGPREDGEGFVLARKGRHSEQGSTTKE